MYDMKQEWATRYLIIVRTNIKVFKNIQKTLSLFTPMIFIPFEVINRSTKQALQ